MTRKMRWVAGAAFSLALVIAGTGIAVATGVADDDKPLTGSTYDSAVAAALRETGGGTVTETETGDDGAAHSVEVRLDDGTQVEVNLDASFNVLARETDDDSTESDDGPDDDGPDHDDRD